MLGINSVLTHFAAIIASRSIFTGTAAAKAGDSVSSPAACTGHPPRHSPKNKADSQQLGLQVYPSDAKVLIKPQSLTCPLR